MRDSLLLEQIKKYVDENNLTKLKKEIIKWERMNDWDLDIGKRVKIFGEGEGKIVDAPNFAVFFVEMDNNFNNSWFAISQTDRNRKWKFIN